MGFRNRTAVGGAGPVGHRGSHEDTTISSGMVHSEQAMARNLCYGKGPRDPGRFNDLARLTAPR